MVSSCRNTYRTGIIAVLPHGVFVQRHSPNRRLQRAAHLLARRWYHRGRDYIRVAEPRHLV